MSSTRGLALLLLLLSALANVAYAATNILPGVAYYPGTEKLTGKLTFMLTHDVTQETNSPTSASVYQFSLEDQKLRKVADSIMGQFIPSREGDPFCVTYRRSYGGLNPATKVWTYSAKLQKGKMLDLESEPRDVVPMGTKIFFLMEMTNPYTGRMEIMEYDIELEKRRLVTLERTGKWQDPDYFRIHVPRGQTNCLHFYFSGVRKPAAEGKDYPSGFYSLEFATGEIRFVGDMTDDKDDEAFIFKTFDGRYVFFEGSGQPIEGFKLVSCPVESFYSESRHPKGENPTGAKVKVLKSFSRLAALFGPRYTLNQMSPDGRFVVVRLQTTSTPKTDAYTQVGWVNTCFLVDATTGATRVFLKDDVEHRTKGSLSAIRWIR